MSEANDNFKEVRRVLRLKRHEVPPPGYFSNFSGDVLARIRAGETGAPEGFWARLQSGSPLWGGWLHIFETKPGVIGGFATSLCLVLLIGVVVAERSDGLAPGLEATTSDASGLGAPAAAMAPAAGSSLLAAENSGIVITTNPVVSLRPAPAMFGAQDNPLFQQASFMPAGQ